MEELIYFLIIVLALIILFLFAIPVIIFGVTANIFIIHLCDGMNLSNMWLLSFVSSMFVAAIYSSVLNITHFRINKIIKDLSWIVIFSTLCVGLLSMYIIPTYKSIKTNNEVLYASTNFFEELTKSYYINDSGEDIILYPITCTYYKDKYNLDCTPIAFCKNMKIEDTDLHIEKTLPLPDSEIPNNKITYYSLTPEKYSEVLKEEEHLLRSRIYLCRHIHRHKHRISHSDVYNWD